MVFESLMFLWVMKGLKHFSFNGKSQFEFQEISSGKWNSIFHNFHETLQGIARLGNFLPEISIPFDFPSGISRTLVYGLLFRNSTI